MCRCLGRIKRRYILFIFENGERSNSFQREALTCVPSTLKSRLNITDLIKLLSPCRLLKILEFIELVELIGCIDHIELTELIRHPRLTNL